MIRLRQIEIDIKEDIEVLLNRCAKKLRISRNDIMNYKIIKRSIDARKKPQLFYCYEIDVEVNNEDNVLKRNLSNDVFSSPKEEYKFIKSGTEILKNRPIIVGSGPCGLFCGYLLAEYGYKPLIIERGEEIDDRVKSIDNFLNTNKLNVNSNIQFGEGGAGTFSDGKLNTLIKDTSFRSKKVLEIFVENGAPEEILYDSKPHIGTDLLRQIIKNIHKKIESFGGNFLFDTCLTNISIRDNKIISIEVNNKDIINTSVVVLAIGHSARDTYKMLYDKNISMTTKSFAIGIRISHPQEMINISQYGVNDSSLPPASYKLTYKAKNNRGVYTFCMCPGGYVINSSSEENKLAINGMSNHNRDSKNANSAVIVTVDENDYGTNPLDGIEFQRRLEKLAYEVGNGKIPIQLYGDFKENKVSTKFEGVEPLFKGDYTFSNLQTILPSYITESLIEGIDYFGTKIKGYDRKDAIIATIESRTSSPVRILRNDNYESNVQGLYPAGEGAGYAGGITSASIDGIKIAEKIASIYK